MIKLLEDYAGKFKNIKFRTPGKNKKGYPCVNFAVEDSVMKFQFTKIDEPKTKAPFGINVYIDKDASPEIRRLKESDPRQNLDLTIVNEDRIAVIRELEEAVMQGAITNKDTWFKDKKNESQIRDMFVSSLHMDGQYDPNLRTKVNCDMESKNHVNIAKIVEVDGVKTTIQMHPDELKNPNLFPIELMAILEVNTVWFQQKSFGITFTTTNILVFDKPPPTSLPFDFGGVDPLAPPPYPSSNPRTAATTTAATTTATTTTTTTTATASCSSSDPPPPPLTSSSSSDEDRPPENNISVLFQQCIGSEEEEEVAESAAKKHRTD